MAGGCDLGFTKGSDPLWQGPWVIWPCACEGASEVPGYPAWHHVGDLCRSLGPPVCQSLLSALGAVGGTAQSRIPSQGHCPLGLHVLLQCTATHQNQGSALCVPGTRAGTAYTVDSCHCDT